jgi:hypothetical protein
VAAAGHCPPLRNAWHPHTSTVCAIWRLLTATSGWGSNQTLHPATSVFYTGISLHFSTHACAQNFQQPVTLALAVVTEAATDSTG